MYNMLSNKNKLKQKKKCYKFPKSQLLYFIVDYLILILFDKKKKLSIRKLINCGNLNINESQKLPNS